MQDTGFNTFFRLMVIVGALFVGGFALEFYGYSTPVTAWIGDLFF